MSRPSRSSPATPELSGVAATLIIGGFGLGGAAGYAFAGMAGAFAGALAAALVSIVIYGAGQLRASARSLSADPVANLQGLAPQQALGIMSAMVAGEGAPAGGAFRSELLDALAKIGAKSKEAPQWALGEVQALAVKYRRSPAVHAELARLRFCLQQDREGVASARTAIGLALDSGMNPMAATLFAEFAPHRDAVCLSAQHRGRLGKVLASRGDEDGAQWCAQVPTAAKPALPDRE